MRLPVDRRGLELLLRGAAFAGLLWLLVGSFMPHRSAGRVSVAGVPSLGLLRQWSLAPPADTLSAQLVAVPDERVRDWMAALRQAGTHVTWSGDGLTSLAMEVERRADPAGGVLVRVGGAPRATITLRDRLGALDTIRLGRVGGAAMVPAAEGAIAASINPNQSATAVGGAVDSTHRILLLGMAGWESKFVVAALSERGWVVDSRLSVAPRLTVVGGTPAAIDTSNYAAVIALDSAATSEAGPIVRYVRAGGGLILGSDAVSLRAFRELLPAGPGRVVAHTGLPIERVTTRADLPIRDLSPLAPNAVLLAQVNGHLVAAARRVGSGRVLALGFGETWRWRMQGDESAVAAHRQWWAANVAAVAYVPITGLEEPVNPAPLAALYQALGPPKVLESEVSHPVSFTWVVLLVMATLLGEWASRRLRGAA